MKFPIFFIFLSFLTIAIVSNGSIINENKWVSLKNQVLLGGCHHPVYCRGELLKMVELNKVFNDSKTFVDMPMKYSIQHVNEEFNILLRKNQQPTKEELSIFLDANFYPAGYEVQPVKPIDWLPNPSILNKVNDPNLKKFAINIHDKWLDLVRIFNVSDLCDECYSSIPVEHPFVISGSRFREFYYWDSYWTIQGLIASNMTSTVKGILMNFRQLISEFGFIPNGARIYYLNRSQPPLFTQMVKKYFEATNDIEFLQETLPIIDAEYQWFMKYRSTEVQTTDGKSYTLNLYNVSNQTPRPESFFEDYRGASVFNTVEEKDFYYSSISSAAESGWDFCSRWFSQSDITNLTTIQTIKVVPVDLNTILYMNEKTISQFYQYLGNDSMSTFYQNRAKERVQAIQSVFWDEESLQWYDLNLNTNTLNKNFYVSNLLPLFAQIDKEIGMSPQKVQQILVRVSGELLGFIGGVPTSLIDSKQQWDFMNSWPNLQYFLIETLMETNTTFSTTIGKSLINRWVTTNYCGWNATLDRGGFMYEKYDSQLIGVRGSGGEYKTQVGFGWTNGVIMHLFNKYSNSIILNSCK